MANDACARVSSAPPPGRVTSADGRPDLADLHFVPHPNPARGKPLIAGRAVDSTLQRQPTSLLGQQYGFRRSQEPLACRIRLRHQRTSSARWDVAAAAACLVLRRARFRGLLALGVRTQAPPPFHDQAER
jgi:hypothetical protein